MLRIAYRILLAVLLLVLNACSDSDHPANNPPEVTSKPITPTQVGKTYQYGVEAEDPENDVLIYTLKNSPEGMSIDEFTGLIEWLPTQVDVFEVVVKVDDGKGNVVLHPFTLTVDTDEIPAITKLNINDGEIATDSLTVALNISAVDDVGISGVSINGPMLPGPASQEPKYEPVNLNQNYSATHNYTVGVDLPDGSDISIAVTVKDNSNNESEITKDTVTYVSTPPHQERTSAAYNHLYNVMDQFHKTFDVYTDQDAADNHFFPTGWVGDTDAIVMNTNWTDNCYIGSSCIKVTFSSKEDNWGSVFWQAKEDDWGDEPDIGFDLTGAEKLYFWAKGEQGEERVEFFIGGIQGDYPDSTTKTSTDVITLTKDWKKYEINFEEQDLSYIIGGFSWKVVGADNSDETVFYIDNIQYNKLRINDPRFLVSYETLPSATADDPDKNFRNVAFLYDNALALLAFLAKETENDMHRAKLIADAMVYAQNNDRSYNDGRLRNAYMAGDLADHITSKMRLPGSWNDTEKKWQEDEFQVSTFNKNYWVSHVKDNESMSLCIVAELKKRAGHYSAYEFYKSAIKTRPEEPAYNLFLGEYFRNYRGPKQPLFADAEKQYYEVRRKLALNSHQDKIYQITSNQVDRGLDYLYERDGFSLLYKQAVNRRLMMFFSTWLNISNVTSDSDERDDIREFTSEALLLESRTKKPVRTLSLDEKREIVRIKGVKESFNRIRVRNKNWPITDVFYRKRMVEGAQIVDYNVFEERKSAEFSDLNLDEYGIGIEKIIGTRFLGDFSFRVQFSQIDRKGLIEGSSNVNAMESINNAELKVIGSRFFGKKKLDGKVDYGKKYISGSLALFSGILRDKEQFGSDDVINDNYFFGLSFNDVRLLSNMNVFDITFQSTLFSAKVENNLSNHLRENEQIRYGVSLLYKKINENNNAWPPISVLGIPFSSLHYVISLSDDRQRKGPKYFENTSVGLKLIAKTFMKKLRRSTILSAFEVVVKKYHKLEHRVVLASAQLSIGF